MFLFGKIRRKWNRNCTSFLCFIRQRLVGKPLAIILIMIRIIIRIIGIAILNIQLPVANGKPDYDKMAVLISAIHKLVIKDVILYSDKRIAAVKSVIS